MYVTFRACFGAPRWLSFALWFVYPFSQRWEFTLFSRILFPPSSLFCAPWRSFLAPFALACLFFFLAPFGSGRRVIFAFRPSLSFSSTLDFWLNSTILGRPLNSSFGPQRVSPALLLCLIRFLFFSAGLPNCRGFVILHESSPPFSFPFFDVCFCGFFTPFCTTQIPFSP